MKRHGLECAAWIAASIALICLRRPSLLHGRLWAEDGHIFYAQAWTLPWHKALFAVANGYINLAGNIAGVLAHAIAPIELAPFIIMAVALAIQLAPYALLITSQDEFLSSRRNLAVAILLLATAPMAEEVWLNAANSQFHLLLAVSLIIALQPTTRTIKFLRCCLCLFAPLCGPGAIALLPLSFAQAWLAKSSFRLLETGFLVAGSIIQFAFFFRDVGGRGLSDSTAPLICAIYAKHFLVPFEGPFSLNGIRAVAQALHDGILPMRAELGVLLLCLISLYLAGKTALDRTRLKAPLWLLGAAFSLMLVSYFGAIGGPAALVDAVAGARYSFAPQALLSLTLVAIIASEHSTLRKLPWSAALIWLLIAAAAGIWTEPLPIFVIGPDWQTEVRAWKTNPSHSLQIWPAGWTIRLNVQPQNASAKPP